MSAAIEKSITPRGDVAIVRDSKPLEFGHCQNKCQQTLARMTDTYFQKLAATPNFQRFLAKRFNSVGSNSEFSYTIAPDRITIICGNASAVYTDNADDHSSLVQGAEDLYNRHLSRCCSAHSPGSKLGQVGPSRRDARKLRRQKSSGSEGEGSSSTSSSTRSRRSQRILGTSGSAGAKATNTSVTGSALTNSALDQRVSQLTQQIIALQQAQERAEQASKQQAGRLEDLTRQLSAANTGKDQSDATVVSLRQQIADLQQTNKINVAASGQQLAELTQQLSTANTGKDRSDAAIAELRQQMEQLATENRTAHTDNQALREQLTTALAAQAMAEKANTAFTTQVNAMTAQIAQQQAAMGEQGREALTMSNYLAGRMSQLEADTAAATKSKSTADAAAASAAKSLAEVEAQNNVLKSTLLEAGQTINSLRTQLGEATERMHDEADAAIQAAADTVAGTGHKELGPDDDAPASPKTKEKTTTQPMTTPGGSAGSGVQLSPAAPDVLNQQAQALAQAVGALQHALAPAAASAAAAEDSIQDLLRGQFATGNMQTIEGARELLRVNPNQVELYGDQLRVSPIKLAFQNNALSVKPRKVDLVDFGSEKRLLQLQALKKQALATRNSPARSTNKPKAFTAAQQTELTRLEQWKQQVASKKPHQIKKLEGLAKALKTELNKSNIEYRNWSLGQSGEINTIIGQLQRAVGACQNAQTNQAKANAIATGLRALLNRPDLFTQIAKLEILLGLSLERLNAVSDEPKIAKTYDQLLNLQHTIRTLKTSLVALTDAAFG
jgi:hypothetical protein